jgi:hypothetical protein
MADATNLNDILSRLKGLVEDAFQRGYKQGAADMRESIMRAASVGPESVSQPAPARTVSAAHKPTVDMRYSDRAPRGLVGKLIDKVLVEHPGLPIFRIEKRVIAMDERVAVKSIGNELRRLKGKKYRQDGRIWFLIDQSVEKGSAEAASNDSSADKRLQFE